MIKGLQFGAGVIMLAGTGRNTMDADPESKQGAGFPITEEMAE